MGQKIIAALPVLFFIALAAIAAIALTNGKDPSVIESPMVGKPLPAFDVGAFTQDDIRGPALINFFASWCPPCEAEHPVLKTLSTAIPLYGIAYKDTVEDRDAFLKRLGNPYIKTGDDPNGKAAIAFGVYGTPTTFVIDADNIIRYRHDAPLVESDIETIRSFFK